MKQIKFIKIAIITLILAFSTTIISFAATVTPNQSVINALKNTGKLPSVYVISAQNYLKTVKLTKAQASGIVTDINNAAKVMKSANTKDITKLSAAQKSKVLYYINDSVKRLGLKATIKKTSKSTYSLVFKNSKGKTVWSLNSKYLKQN